ncbi:MAG: hypothetical protein K5905_10335, partial [Roseibium sp.]|nr:hypothetical protein [Roseibium sp.]
DTRSSTGAQLVEAVAILGWREGSWFAHIHAYWREHDAYHLGHLLPHSLTVDGDTKISGFGLKGARFVAAPDPETEFTLFRVQKDQLLPQGRTANALIFTKAWTGLRVPIPAVPTKSLDSAAWQALNFRMRRR